MHCTVQRVCEGSTDDDNPTAKATGQRPVRRSPRRDRMAIPVIGRAANALILGLALGQKRTEHQTNLMGRRALGRRCSNVKRSEAIQSGPPSTSNICKRQACMTNARKERSVATKRPLGNV